MEREATRDLASDTYDKLLEQTAKLVRELRVILQQQEAKEREREWIGNQVQGELDENKLVDGVAGERLIYRRRAEPDHPWGLLQRKPKRLSFVVDVSASMAYFNDSDGRLDRTAQIATLLFESLAGFEERYEWNLVGHSGSGPQQQLVDYGAPPRTKGARSQVIKELYRASDTAFSGDTTVEAIEKSVDIIANRPDCDDYLVFVLSDANLGSYGITPDMIGKALTRDPKVTASAIFIAEPDAADFLARGLPVGKGHVCLDAADLPKIFSGIFARAATGG